MNLTLERTALLPALRDVSSASARSTIVPITSNVLMSAAPDALSLTCTDFDLWGSTSIRADVSEPGSLCIPVEPLLRFVDSLPEGSQVSLTGDGNRCKVRCGRSSATFGVLNASDFPLFRGASDAEPFDVPVADLRRLFERTVDGAAKNDKVRLALIGVHLFSRDGRLFAEATDTRVLFRDSIPSSAVIPDDIIVPAPAIRALMRILPAEGTASVEVSPAYISVTCGQRKMLSKLVAEKYPDIDKAKLIVTDLPSIATAKTAELKRAADRMAGLAADDDRTMMVEFTATGIRIATLDDTGDDAVDAEIAGPVATRAMNSQVLKRALSCVEGETVRLGFDVDDIHRRLTVFDSAHPSWVGVASGLRR